MGSVLTAVPQTATPNQALMLRSGPGPGSQADRGTEGARSTEVGRTSARILGFGVREAGRSRGRGEQKDEEEWEHMRRQGYRHTADGICGGKDRKLSL